MKKGGEKNFSAAPEEETGNEAPKGNRVSEKMPVTVQWHYTYKTYKYTRNIYKKITVVK
jgi:hypothetical protein